MDSGAKDTYTTQKSAFPTAVGAMGLLTAMTILTSLDVVRKFLNSTFWLFLRLPG